MLFILSKYFEEADNSIANCPMSDYGPTGLVPVAPTVQIQIRRTEYRTVVVTVFTTVVMNGELVIGVTLHQYWCSEYAV